MIAPTSFFSDYGCSVRILEEIRALRRLGHGVRVCTYKNGQDVPGLCIYRTPSIPFREHYEVGSSPLKIAFDVLLFWKVLFRALRRRPDVIHAHMHEGAFIGLLVGGLLRIPLVFDFQGSLTGEMIDHKFLRRDSPFFRPLLWLETTIDRRSPLILTSSQNAQNLLISEFGCRPERVQTVPDGVDTDAFYPRTEGEGARLAELQSRLGIPFDRKIVVYLGLLASYQGTDALLEAAAAMLRHRTDLHFLIMGFPCVDEYRQRAKQMGISDHTTFAGKIPYSQARDHLALGDLAVAPKLSTTEGSGKILNYMAVGLPTVAFETPVGREYLGQEGLYAERGSPGSLAEVMLAAIDDPDAARRSAALRQAAVSSRTWGEAAKVIVRAYERVTS